MRLCFRPLGIRRAWNEIFAVGPSYLAVQVPVSSVVRRLRMWKVKLQQGRCSSRTDRSKDGNIQKRQ
jgi:hypothetical protein